MYCMYVCMYFMYCMYVCMYFMYCMYVCILEILEFLFNLFLSEPPCPDEQNLCNGECIPDKDKDCIPDPDVRVILLMILYQPV